MNRTFAFALLIVFAISGAAVTVWYVNDDQDVSTIVSSSGPNAGDTTSAPKKIVKTLTGESIAAEVTPLAASDVEIKNTSNESDKNENKVAGENEEVNSASTSAQAADDANTEEAIVEPKLNNPPTAEAEIDPSLSFDVIRVEKSGDTVLAGRAPAGSNVRIVDGTTILGNIEADNNG